MNQKKIIIILLLLCLFVNCSIALGNNGNNKKTNNKQQSKISIPDSVPDEYIDEYIRQSKALRKAIDYLDFIVELIRLAAAAYLGLHVTIIGYQIYRLDNGIEHSKQNFKKAAYGLFFVFWGQALANWFMAKLFDILFG
jgi:hypothetical protein